MDDTPAGVATLALTFELALPDVPDGWRTGNAFQTFQEDVVDLRQSTSLFACTHFPALSEGEVTLHFPQTIRIETEGKSLDHGGFADSLSAHYTVSVARLPQGRGTATIALDFRDVDLDPAFFDSLTLIQKIWAARELQNLPRIDTTSHQGDMDLQTFLTRLLETTLGHAPGDLSPPRLGLFVESATLLDRVLAYRANPEAARDPVVVSLAGTAQNVLDHANQDRGEIMDSLDPIYAEERLLFLASQRLAIELVDRSRSFREGRQIVGTCPYFLLVHTLACHNEMVLRRWVEKVSDVYTRILEVQTRLSDKDVTRLDAGDVKLIEALEKQFADIRVSVMIDIRSTAFQNSFRYDTEREMFDRLLAARGLDRIAIYWQAVLDSCDQAITDIARLHDASRARRLNVILAALTCVTIFSVIIDLRNEIDAGSAMASVAFASAAILGVFGLLIVLLKRYF